MIVAACGGGGGDGPDGPPGGGDGPGATCRAPADFGTVTPVNQEALSEMGTGAAVPDLVELDADLDQASAKDQLSIQLYKGYGPFTASDIVPGTYPLSGADAQRSSCGACVLLFTDVLEGVPQGTPYLASGGTLTVSSVTPNFTGMLTGVTLTHVNIDQATLQSTPHADGCTAQVSAMSFDATVTPQ